MAIVPKKIRFIGISEEVDLKERQSAVNNSKTNPYSMEDISSSAKIGSSIENASVGSTYTIDLSKDNHDLTLTGNTTLDASNLPSVGETVVVTLYVSSISEETLTIPSEWSTYGDDYAVDGTRNQVALCVSNNALSGVTYDLSISNAR